MSIYKTCIILLRSLFFVLAFFIQIKVKAEHHQTHLVFAVHPLHNPQKLFKLYNPICKIINEKIPDVTCVFEASKNYEDFNDKIKNKNFDVMMPNPYQTIKAIDFDYEVFAKWSDDHVFKGVILVRQDSGINSLADLKNKNIAIPSRSALVGAMIPINDIASNFKLYPDKDYSVETVGSQESAMLAVLNKKSDVGITWYTPWEQFNKSRSDDAKQLKLLYETETYPSNSIMYKKSLKKEIKEKLNNLFLQMHFESAPILAEIGVSKFEKATIDTYKKIFDFEKKYKSNIGIMPW